MSLSEAGKNKVMEVLTTHLPSCDRNDVMDIRDQFELRLAALRDEARKSLAEKFKVQRAALEEQIRIEAEAANVDLDELVGGNGTDRKRTPIPAVYQHPDNPKLTWSGRGKRPAWFTAQLDRGQTEDSMRIVPRTSIVDKAVAAVAASDIPF